MNKKVKLVNFIEEPITDEFSYEKFKPSKTDRITLEEDFIPYIIPNVYIGRSQGNKLSFCEGSDSFLSVI